MSRLSINRTRFYLILAVILILIYILPYWILQGQAHILIHDNLDSVFVRHKLLVDTQNIFSSNPTLIEPFMSGISRQVFPSEFNFTMLWFSLFNPLTAYLLERTIQTLVGFVGMYILLRRHIIPNEQYSLIPIGVALTFGLLPFWPFGGLAVAGLPLILSIFLDIRNHSVTYWHWLIIIIYPFYASLVFSGIFFLVLLFTIVLYDLFIKKNFRWAMFTSIGILCASFTFTQYRLFLSLVSNKSYVSHRSEMALAGANTLKASLVDTRIIFLDGQFHAQSLHTYILYVVVIGGIFLIWKKHQARRLYLLVILFLVTTSVLYGFWKWDGIQFVIEPIVTKIPINFGRFHFLHPFLWSVLFAISLLTIRLYVKWGKVFVILFLAGQLLYVFSHHELWRNRHTPTYDEFFAEAQFEEIKDFINQPVDNYRVVSLGIHPSISLYNGFYSLDGYIADYPVTYKHQFREVIASELAKNNQLRQYFDTWGSRAYIFADELGNYHMNEKDNSVIIHDLALNVDVLRDMGGQFILSAVEINTDTNPQYSLMKVFKHASSAWDIYLYELN